MSAGTIDASDVVLEVGVVVGLAVFEFEHADNVSALTASTANTEIFNREVAIKCSLVRVSWGRGWTILAFWK